MSGLSYSFVFECEECGTEATVTRTEARDLYPNPDSLTAVDEALQQEKGWTKSTWGAYCPDCEPPTAKTDKGRR
jgi:Zn finger protein HypA/HybF involved in hydrogenase expression